MYVLVAVCIEFLQLQISLSYAIRNYSFYASVSHTSCVVSVVKMFTAVLWLCRVGRCQSLLGTWWLHLQSKLVTLVHTKL